MLSIKEIKTNTKKIKRNLINRGVSRKEFDHLYFEIQNRQSFLKELEELQAQKNFLSKKIGVDKRANKSIDKTLEQVEVIHKKYLNISDKFYSIDKQVEKLLLNIPNTTLDDVPIGQEEANKVLDEENTLGRGLVSKMQTHYQLAKHNEWIDISRAVKMSGTRFVIFKNEGACLLRALQNYMLDVNISKGYLELNVPHLVWGKIMQGTGQLPKFKEDLFKIEGKDMWLIPTAEVPLTNYFNNEIIDLSKPIKLTSFTKCFRSEAGSSGKDTKGLIRSHEFNKVEIVQITSKKDALKAFEEVLNDAKDLLRKLKIPFRSLLLATKDTGFSSKKTIDLELWLPSKQKYCEVSSISYFGDFQARRASIRYKQDGKNYYAHTINGSALAIDRVFAAIMEIYQNEDNSVDIPKVLIPYMGISKIKKKW